MLTAWQSFGPQKRPAMLQPPPPRNSLFESLKPDDSQGKREFTLLLDLQERAAVCRYDNF